jgi:hypothetical protein
MRRVYLRLTEQIVSIDLELLAHEPLIVPRPARSRLLLPAH